LEIYKITRFGFYHSSEFALSQNDPNPFPAKGGAGKYEIEFSSGLIIK